MDEDLSACSPHGGAMEAGFGPISAHHFRSVSDHQDSRTRLTPQDAFPADLSTLPLVMLHVLDSKVRRQLDHELLCALQCPHPLTLDHHHELVTEIDAREITDVGWSEHQDVLQ